MAIALAPRRLAAALSLGSALAAAAPGVPPSSAFDAAVLRPEAPSRARAALEASLRDEAFRLWERCGFGADRTERAAWVLPAPDGVAWKAWPWDRRYLESRWLGPTPANAVAIVHTHPAIVDPRPSFTDVATAVRLGIPVYTVSRSGIWKAEPSGALARVGDERWWAGCASRRGCGDGVSDALSARAAENSANPETAARPLRIPE
jgi:hypothetical protein